VDRDVAEPSRPWLAVVRLGLKPARRMWLGTAVEAWSWAEEQAGVEHGTWTAAFVGDPSWGEGGGTVADMRSGRHATVRHPDPGETCECCGRPLAD
jgi:hypothetical protein